MRQDAIRAAGAVALLAALAPAGCNQEMTTGMGEIEAGMKRVFGREIDLLAPDHLGEWKHVGAGGLDVADGVARTRGGPGVSYYAARPFADFYLRLEFRRTEADDDSGVLLRFPDPAGDASVPVEKGYQVEIGPVLVDSTRSMAAIDQLAAPTGEMKLKPAGQWNSMTVIAVGHDLTVQINGRAVTRYTGDRLLEGYVGLQNHDERSRVEFRSLKIVALGFLM